jgi:hypothetical protein
LLLNIRLCTPLQRLALIVLLLRRTLSFTIPRDARNRTPNSPLHTIRHPLSEITQLPLRLLCLTLGILLLARLLEILVADEATHRFFGAADCLVPATGLTIWIVGCYARGTDGDAADAGAGFGEVVFGGCFCFLVVGCLFVGRVACDATDGRLDCTRGLEGVVLANVIERQ